MNDNILLEEFCEKITYLKLFFLGDTTVTNKQFFLVLKNIFIEKYDNISIDLKKISEITNVDENDVNIIYNNLKIGSEISSKDFDLLKNIVNISEKSEEERCEIIEKMIFSKEKNSKIFIDFKPTDIISNEGIRELEKYICKSLFGDKIQSIIKELEVVLNPVYISNYECIEFLDKYKDMFKKDINFTKLQEKNVFLVKEEGEFLKLYDVNTLMPVFSQNIKINKRMVSRIPVEKDIFVIS